MCYWEYVCITCFRQPKISVAATARYHHTTTAGGNALSALPTCCTLSCSLLRALFMSQWFGTWTVQCWWWPYKGCEFKSHSNQKIIQAFQTYFMAQLPMLLGVCLYDMNFVNKNGTCMYMCANAFNKENVSDEKRHIVLFSFAQGNLY